MKINDKEYTHWKIREKARASAEEEATATCKKHGWGIRSQAWHDLVNANIDTEIRP